MRILIDQAVYDMRNKGNVALLQAALWRLKHWWPQASFEVMTTAPHILKLYCPDVIPVDVYGVHDWSRERGKLSLLHRFMPEPVLRGILEVREEINARRNWHAAMNGFTDLKAAPSPSHEIKPAENPAVMKEVEDLPSDLEQALKGADLVVATGGGYLVDSDKGSAMHVLSLLGRAIQMGKFTAMVGQGMGRIDDPELKNLLREILPQVDIILVRERLFSIPLLHSLGVSREKIHMTGDDAVEFGYAVATDRIGRDIGVSIRLAAYTEVGQADLERIRPVLHRVAARRGAHLMGLPTTCTGSASDQYQIAKLLEGYPDIINSLQRFESIPSLLNKVGQCRVVVTGAFHSAVFALAQGIPVIGLAKSREYSIKFEGLIDQFGEGCVMLPMNDPGFDNRLAQALDWAWESAESLKPKLREAARVLVERNRLGYQYVWEAYEARGNQSPTSSIPDPAR